MVLVMADSCVEVFFSPFEFANLRYTPSSGGCVASCNMILRASTRALHPREAVRSAVALAFKSFIAPTKAAALWTSGKSHSALTACFNQNIALIGTILLLLVCA